MSEQLEKPSGTYTDIKRVRTVMTSRHREEQPQLNQPEQDTIPGEGSADE